MLRSVWFLFSLVVIKTLYRHHIIYFTAADHNINIICIQEHRYYPSKLEINYCDTGNG